MSGVELFRFVFGSALAAIIKPAQKRYASPCQGQCHQGYENYLAGPREHVRLPSSACALAAA